MNSHNSVLHELYEQRNLQKYRAFLSGTSAGGGGNSSSHSGGGKGKQAANSNRDSNNAGSGGSYSYGAGSLSRSPRFGFTHGGDGNASKEEVNARDRQGRTVLHLVVTDGGSAIETLPTTTKGRKAASADKPATACLEYLEPLLQCYNINVNLQDKENGWTALHRAVYAGNLVAARRLLQHNDIDTAIRDLEGLTAFELLNSTILGTNPSDSLENPAIEAQQSPRRELVTWGANRNFVLGLQGDSDRTFPERVALERTPHSKYGQDSNGAEESFEPLPVRKIAMEKLHSGLITDEKRNNFRLCGFGTTGRLGHASQHPQFSFEPLRDFGNQTVVDFALGQDHTVLCTDKGDAWTFGLNTFSVLGYPVENTTPNRPGLMEDPVQATPKRLVGILKKEFVIGVAASRYHTVVYTEDSLFTWGKNNGQLGYPALATPIQHTPRKVTTLTQPVKQVCATEAATVCLLEGGEVFVLHRDGYFKISFPTTRFSSAMQVYRPPNVSSRPTIFKVAGSGSTFIALSSSGDVFSWQLDNPSLEAPSSTPSSGRDIKPTRIWEDKKTFTAVTDAAIANDTIVLSTRSGHVFVRSRKKELNTVKGFDLRSSGSSATASGNAKKGQYKFTRVANLQRVVNVAVSSSGGFGAIRSDAPLLQIDEVGSGLSDSLLGLLPHYQRLEEEETKDAAVQGGTAKTSELAAQEDLDDDEDESIEQDIIALNQICKILLKWDSSWAISGSNGSDILVVAGASGIKVPAHTTVLAARSTALAEALQGRSGNGVSVSRVGATTLSLPKCSHISVLLLLHYLYSDSIPAIYDPRLFSKIQSTYPALKLQVGNIKNELHSLASALQLPALTQALRAYGKAIPSATLADDLARLSENANEVDVVLEADGQDFSCHSVVLRSRCPFFAAMFDDPDWYAPRTESDEDDTEGHVLRIDLKHISADVMQLMLRHLYTDTGSDLLESKEFARIDEKLDYVMLIMSAANELLLDRLKAICSSIVRPLINMQTVCSILCEAIFYEAANLQDCCMQYICCNIETMLEQRLLDILPIYALDRLTAFCGRKQIERLPRTQRSGPKLAELRIQHADWLKNLDSGRYTGSYRKYSRQNSAKSPMLSPATFSSSLRMSPNLSSLPTLVLSPPRRQIEIPPSPSLSASPSPSPLVEATNAGDEDLFDMDDLKLDDTDVPTPTRLPSPAPQLFDTPSFPLLSSASTSKVPWQRPTQLSSTPPRSLRDIMSQAGPKPSAPSPGRLSESHPMAPTQSTSTAAEDPISPPLLRLSQRDRKRQHQSQLGQQATEVAATPAASSSPWRPTMPAAWKPPELPKERPSLNSIQSAQASSFSPSAGPLPSPALPSSFRRASTTAGSPSSAGMTASPAGTPVKQSPVPIINPASAIGAPIITPTRAQPKRNVSDTGGPPERRSHDVPWVNYTSTVVAPPVFEEGPGQSFATIQNAQATEREALRVKRGAMSLAEIQEEENTRREEAAFLAWFEEESKRTQADSAPQPSGRGGRGGSRGRGRGENKGRGGGGQRGRGRGSGTNTPKKAVPPTDQ